MMRYGSQKDFVMTGLDPAIHDLARGSKDVDARLKAGHDDECGVAP
jgi:hypothetical protein